MSSSSPEKQSRDTDGSQSPTRPQIVGITPRAFVIGLLLVPVMCFWNEYTEVVAQATDLAAMSLIIAVVFALFVLVTLNLLLKRFAPRWAFSQAELMYIYIMQTCSIGISGIGMAQFLVTFTGNIFYYGTPENRWQETFLPAVRPWLLPDPEIVRPFYVGQSTFWKAEHIQGWLAPILVWSLYITVLLGVMLCITVILRRQWMDRERLAFPITQLPLELARDGGSEKFFRSRQMWVGFLIPVVLESLASLNYLYPNVPFFPIKPSDPRLNLTPLFEASPPWNGIGSLQLSFYPLVIGLTYFLPLDVAFSLWFFYLFTKVQNVVVTALGYRDPGASLAMSRMPYIGEQSAGAFVGLALFVLYGMRAQLREVFRRALQRRQTHDEMESAANEAMPYRTALLGMIAGGIFLVGFGMAIGMAWWVPIVFFALFYLYVITFTRIRAEAGLPWGFGPYMNAHDLMKTPAGTSVYTFQTQVGLHMLLWHDLDFRTTMMPNHLEAQKIGIESRMNLRHVAIVILIATVVACLSSWAALLTIYYDYGAASAKVNSWRTSMGNEPWRVLKDVVDNPSKPDPARMQGVLVGMIVTAFLLVMRQRFVGWPFHPTGYAIAGTFTMEWLWCATLVGWLIKWLIVRYGGMAAYRRYIPFFIGLILGDYITGSVWAIYGSVTGVQTYRAFPI
ncbi:MAG: DUF6785 family protein [Chloroherpetonaceae bacterium]|nr:OPT/YSL family transporter [Chthonomonadaceae bacterium]MDW8206349.1 DUF6785 family protein [Chloroherpetonaceae bacterium]